MTSSINNDIILSNMSNTNVQSSPVASIVNSTNQNVNGNGIVVVLDTVDIAPTTNDLSTTVANSIKATTSGVYQVDATVNYATIGSSDFSSIYLMKNNAILEANDELDNAAPCTLSLKSIVQLAAGDVLSLKVDTPPGAGSLSSAATTKCRLTVMKITN